MIMEKMTEQRGGLFRKQSVRELHSDWIRAGCPSNFRQEYIKGKGVQRVLSTADQKEILEDKRRPERAKIRKAKGILKVRKCDIKA